MQTTTEIGPSRTIRQRNIAAIATTTATATPAATMKFTSGQKVHALMGFFVDDVYICLLHSKYDILFGPEFIVLLKE